MISGAVALGVVVLNELFVYDLVIFFPLNNIEAHG